MVRREVYLDLGCGEKGYIVSVIPRIGRTHGRHIFEMRTFSQHTLYRCVIRQNQISPKISLDD